MGVFEKWWCWKVGSGTFDWKSNFQTVKEQPSVAYGFQRISELVRGGLKIYNVKDWMFVPYLSLILISSYVVQDTKETGNIDHYYL